MASWNLCPASSSLRQRSHRSSQSWAPAGGKYQLNDGREMPRIGFGTYRMAPGNETYASVSYALKAGYRMIDTAQLYKNEADVGRAIRDSGIPRGEIFVTTKLWNDAHGYEKALNSGLDSHKKLDVGYIDLLLIHSPYEGKIVETYDAMLELQKQKVVRSVGVSNFGAGHLRAIEEYCRPPPAVNQFELHPLNVETRGEVLAYCREHKILVQAYGSVLSGHADLLKMAAAAAGRHGKTEAQVMLRWGLAQGFQVIPKSTHMDRIRENLDVFDFELSHEELTELDSLPGELKGEYWDPLSSPAYAGNVGPKPASCPKK